MKSVIAFVALFAVAQAVPQGTTAAPAGATPTCVAPCIESINSGACKTATDAAAMTACFCEPSNQAVVAACAISACPGQLEALQSLAAGACPTGAAAGAAGAGGSNTETGGSTMETGGIETPALGGANTETSGTAESTGAETGTVESTGEALPTGSASGSATGTTVETGAAAGNATGSSPTATGTNSAGDRVVVGGSIIFAALAALIAL